MPEVNFTRLGRSGREVGRSWEKLGEVGRSWEKLGEVGQVGKKDACYMLIHVDTC